MSRIGKKPVIIPSGITAAINGQLVSIKGPKGELKCELNSLVNAVISKDGEQEIITVCIKNENNKDERAQWGTARALIQNMVEGVTKGFEIKLEINGVGFRANTKGKQLVLHVGFSHEVLFNIPEGVEVAVNENIITIKGFDKQLVGETAANIRKIKKPEPYKGKGIKYIDEVVRRKAGKAQKAGSA